MIQNNEINRVNRDAAPELLAALKECLFELEALGWGEAGYTKRAKAAIAKATKG